MHQKQKELQQRFEGFLKTPNLWVENSVFSIEQYDLPEKTSTITIEIDEKQRLGKYIEQFVFYQLKQNGATLIAENIQIQKNKTTLGELDCIFKENESTIHLEIVYKFYLYDATVGNSEIEHFIGPNRKDSLLEKLNKLKEKQLPLLYSTTCKENISMLNIDWHTILQKVCFKAQLFIPFGSKVQLKILNNQCIVGFYITENQLHNFKDCKFYIPIKKDWLLTPTTHVNWIRFTEFKTTAKAFVNKKHAPLFWVKQKNGAILKLFLVWW